jgi:hypothetical protein
VRLPRSDPLSRLPGTFVCGNPYRGERRRLHPRFSPGTRDVCRKAPSVRARNRCGRPRTVGYCPQRPTFGVEI